MKKFVLLLLSISLFMGFEVFAEENPDITKKIACTYKDWEYNNGFTDIKWTYWYTVRNGWFYKKWNNLLYTAIVSKSETDSTTEEINIFNYNCKTGKATQINKKNLGKWIFASASVTYQTWSLVYFYSYIWDWVGSAFWENFIYDMSKNKIIKVDYKKFANYDKIQKLSTQWEWSRDVCGQIKYTSSNRWLLSCSINDDYNNVKYIIDLKKKIIYFK